MIKINKEDSIIDIIIKMKHHSKKDIILEFPFGHAVLHNYTSLKILKNNAQKKDLIIITSDLTAKKIGKKLGIKYSLIKNPDLLEHNYSFGEYFKFLSKNYFREIKNIFSKNNFEEIYSPYLRHTKEKKAKIGLFFVAFIVSIVLFFFVFYFAVNKTYIYITPEITIRTAEKNFYFEHGNPENAFNNNAIIPLKEVSKLVYLSEKFSTTGIDISSTAQSSGHVMFHNLLPEKIRLKASTRLSTPDGIIYTVAKSVDIPAAFTDGSGETLPGNTKAFIQAAHYDLSGGYIGSRGNTGSGVYLTLPGLKEDQDKIFAYTDSEISGGNEDFIKTLGKDDINNASLLLEGKLKDLALSQVKNEISESNKNNSVVYEILGVDDIIDWSDLGITGAENITIGDQLDNFTLHGTVKIKTYTYNTESVLNHLGSVIKSTLLTEVEDILHIDASSLRIALVVDRSESPLRIKATAEVQASFIHNFLSQKNNYVEKLKYTIAGVNKDSAKQLLLNNQKISNVEIKTRPFFMENISNIPSNIEFIVEE
ncbi:MAG: hypothetical protein GY828_01280 [Candidatus Gracilibacteria bacterium]|nr:hypothetical protein [Candidatus Gracilibacteria bacterium]